MPSRLQRVGFIVFLTGELVVFLPLSGLIQIAGLAWLVLAEGGILFANTGSGHRVPQATHQEMR